MDLEKEISKLQSYDLFTAYEQIRKYERSGVLIDGIVRKYAEDFAKDMKQEDYKFLRMTCELFYAEMAKRYYESMKV